MCMRDETLAKKIDELKELKAKQDAISLEMDKLKDELKGYLGEKGIDEYKFLCNEREYKFSYKTSVQRRFDSDSFKNMYSELYESFRVETPSTKFLYS